MQKKIAGIIHFLKIFFLLFKEFFLFFLSYSKKKILTTTFHFEKNKNTLVKLFTVKRGRYNRPFLHLSAMAVLFIGVMVAPFLADTYPIFSSRADNNLQNLAQANQSITIGDNVFQTEISSKPRDKVITYTVERGDTLSTIAQKFGISTDTIKWANDLVGDNITVGDTLNILPVSGIEYKVQKGDSVYSIAKKFATEPQKIVDFPFNDFANPETFALVEGQTLIVPDGIKPSEQPFIQRQVFLAQGPSGAAPSSYGFTWPLQGVVSQFASWYHMALDIAAPYGSPIFAAKSGTVAEVYNSGWNYGYGTHVVIDHGGGFRTLYAHMEKTNVNVGDTVSGGQTLIGWVGMTGRTTGPHTHFEIYRNDVLVNPLPYLQ